MASDPLAALAGGFIDPAAPDALPAHLRGEQGLAIARWLGAGGVTATQLMAAEKALSAHAARYRATLSWSALREDFAVLIFEHGFHQSPRLAALLQEALPRLNNPAQLAGFFRHLSWLAQVLALGEPI